MNEKTAKLLKKFASATSQNEREVKRWWHTLNQHERASERKKMQDRLSEDA